MAAVPKNLTFLRPSQRLGSIVLFVAGEHTYDVDDAVASANFRDELDTAVRTTLELAAAEDSAEEEIGGEKLQKRADDLRYKRGLITAGETEEWLDARGMTLDDFSRWIYQSHCGEGRRGPYQSTAPDDFPDLLRIHLWMSDEMDRLASALSRRVAAKRELAEQGDVVETASVKERFLARHGLNELALPAWLAAMGRDDSWLAAALLGEAAFEQLRASVLTAERRSRKLASIQSSLVKVEIESLQVDSEAAAREASLCVADDGASLSEVASDSGYCAERSELWLDTADDTLSRRLLGASPGDVVGPIHDRGRFHVYQVLRKIAPTLSNPAVLERVDRIIADEFFADLCARHVQARDVARIGT
ncbi:MAG: hypothetical protein ACXW3E_13380 [Thermoanaerobaculia bacterium]